MFGAGGNLRTSNRGLAQGKGRFGVCFVVRGKEGVCIILSKKMWAVEDVYGLLSFHIYKDIK